MRIAGHPYHKLICHETLLSNPGRCICIMGISREACKSILSFLKDVIDLATSEAGSAFRPHLKEALSARGPALFRLLIAACTGALPESRNYDVSSLSQERKSTRLVVPNVFSLRARISFNSSSCPGFHGEVLLVFQVSELLHALTSCIGQPALTWLHDSLNAIPPHSVHLMRIRHKSCKLLCWPPHPVRTQTTITGCSMQSRIFPGVVGEQRGR